jgi:hypothetical protein
MILRVETFHSLELGFRPNKSDAQRAVEALRLTINEQTPRQQLRDISIGTLVEHYREHALPDIFYETPPRHEEPEEEEAARRMRPRRLTRAISRSGSFPGEARIASSM